ncbi:LytTR family transcriptional regulator DNA-binding domain-containing protein [Salirhabdus sp. Marseille-P4669]|uniref:LytTR family transcriptional regulator DNA-binding domain-containing protein n=1 Tax=Salirhabdus sp. Marseille-P4669 TaxID=2042310 RepID=UPI000C7C0FBE|nr:LytTR family transcriptional regulator DNA-binding domain-containing protein [Salirhabdus sp. Marseille-P4669]
MTKDEQNMYMTVLERRDDGTMQPYTLNLLEVDFIELENRHLVYYIGQNKYYQITKLQQIQEVLNETNGFVSLDRINLVNMKNVKDYDEKLGKIYFEKQQDKERNFTTIAKIKQRLFSPLIKRAIANNTDVQVTKKLSKAKQQVFSQLEKE